MSRFDVSDMIKRRAAAAGLLYSICCDTFTGDRYHPYLEDIGALEPAQTIATTNRCAPPSSTIALARAFPPMRFNA
jgi:hypothetical protein